MKSEPRFFQRILFTLCGLILCAGTLQAQSERITFSNTELTVKQAFTELQNQTRYGLGYNNTLFDTNRRVTFSARQTTLSEAMKQILDGTGFTYIIVRDVISITRGAEPASPVVAQRQPQPIQAATGDVYEQNNPGYRSAAPNPRPEGEEVVMPVTEIQAIVPARPEFYSTYTPVEKYTQNHDVLPTWAIKTNLLYDIAALTPNLSVEFGLGRRTSLDFSASYNPWNRLGSETSNKKLVHMIIKPEFRYWLCERFTGHFFGVHALYANYNISQHKIPGMFDKENRYEGNGYGAGISYGYQLPISKRWSAEFSVGAGVVMLDYDRYGCVMCNKSDGKFSKTYFGPTTAAISLVYIIK